MFGDNVNSKTDYTTGLIVLDCGLRDSDHQMSKLHSKFYLIHDSKKSQNCTSKSPNPKSTTKFPRSWGKS